MDIEWDLWRRHAFHYRAIHLDLCNAFFSQKFVNQQLAIESSIWMVRNGGAKD